MSLKTYISDTQSYLKEGSGNTLFALQAAPTYKLLDIYEAYPSSITADSGAITADSGIITADQVTYDITSITAVKIDSNNNEISRTSLATDLIKWEYSQWVADSSKDLTPYFDQCIYYLEFATSEQTIKTEPFLVTEMNLFIRADMTIITADSGLILTDTTNLTI